MRFYNNVKMSKQCFYALVDVLTSKGLLTQSPHAHVSVVEEVILFMRTIGMHHRQRDTWSVFNTHWKR
ncbi:hypothetical protein ACS0TY_014411 [Phlomoides rotata]